MMARDVCFIVLSWYHYHLWHDSDSKIFRKVTSLIDECCRNPFKGTGKPEPLKREKAWSRRIDEKHRFVYSVTDEHLVVISCRNHYGDK